MKTGVSEPHVKRKTDDICSIFPVYGWRRISSCMRCIIPAGARQKRVSSRTFPPEDLTTKQKPTHTSQNWQKHADMSELSPLRQLRGPKNLSLPGRSPVTPACCNQEPRGTAKFLSITFSRHHRPGATGPGGGPGGAAAHSHWPVLGCGEHLHHHMTKHHTGWDRRPLQRVVETAGRMLRADRASVDHFRVHQRLEK